MAGKSLNKVTLIGHVGKDPELKYTGSGMAVASFTLATNDRRKINGEWQDHTEWHNITAWDKLAEICNQYAKKGKQIYVEGRIQTDTYEKEGQKHYSTKIVINDMILLGGGGQGSSNGGYQSSGGYQQSSRPAPAATSLPEPDFEPAPTDDLPF